MTGSLTAAEQKTVSFVPARLSTGRLDLARCRPGES